MPQADIATLERRISVERLRPYRTAVGDDISQAIALYEWNARIAASFWLILGHLEVLVRNAMHEQLAQWSRHHHMRQPWYLGLASNLNKEMHLSTRPQLGDRLRLAGSGRRMDNGGGGRTGS